MTVHLGIDFGTSNTAAVLRDRGGRVEPVLFDGSPVLPSAVFRDPTAGLLTGRDAVFSARLTPERFEPNPKLRVDDGHIHLGADVAVTDMLAAVLRRVADTARDTTGAAPDRVTLTHPAAWGPRRLAVLRTAAETAELPQVDLLPEPIAAAASFHGGDATSDPDAPVVVYDWGAGTFDVAVVAGSRVLAFDGLDDVGGLDVDAAVIDAFGRVHGAEEPLSWRRLIVPTTAADRRARRQLAEDVREAKELLSRASQTFVHLPLLDRDAPLGREQLVELAAPLVRRTVATVAAVIDAAAAIDAAAVTAPRIFLVGGASRMPLVATELHRALGVGPEIAARPELAVAIGAVSIAGPDADATALSTAGPIADTAVSLATQDVERRDALIRTATALAALRDKRTTERRRQRAPKRPPRPPRTPPRDRPRQPKKSPWPRIAAAVAALSVLGWVIVQTTDREPAFAARPGDCVDVDRSKVQVQGDYADHTEIRPCWLSNYTVVARKPPGSHEVCDTTPADRQALLDGEDPDNLLIPLFRGETWEVTLCTEKR